MPFIRDFKNAQSLRRYCRAIALSSVALLVTFSPAHADFDDWFCNRPGMEIACEVIKDIRDLSLSEGCEQGRRGTELRQYRLDGSENVLWSCESCASPVVLADGSLAVIGPEGIYKVSTSVQQTASLVHELTGALRIFSASGGNGVGLWVLIGTSEGTLDWQYLSITGAAESPSGSPPLPGNCDAVIQPAVQSCRAVQESSPDAGHVVLIFDDLSDHDVPGKCLFENKEKPEWVSERKFLVPMQEKEESVIGERWSRFDPAWDASGSIVFYVARKYK